MLGSPQVKRPLGVGGTITDFSRRGIILYDPKAKALLSLDNVYGVSQEVVHTS